MTLNDLCARLRVIHSINAAKMAKCILAQTPCRVVGCVISVRRTQALVHLLTYLLTYTGRVKPSISPTNSNNTTVKNAHAPPTSTSSVSPLFTIPSVMESGNVPRILCRILGYTFPIMLVTEAQVSVLPLKMAKRFQPPIAIPNKTCDDRTFGTNKVTLRGPALLPIHTSSSSSWWRTPSRALPY